MSESKLDPVSQEAWDYLLEVVGDYKRYMSELGSLGLAAPNLLYFRDEIQEGLNEFKTDRRVDFRKVWELVKTLDEQLKERTDELVREVGHANFKQYRLINDPPKAHWWWFLDKMVAAPPPPPPIWQFWRHMQLKTEPVEPAPAEPEPELPPAEFEAQGDRAPPKGP